MNVADLKVLIENLKTFINRSKYNSQLEKILHDTFIKEELDYVYAIILDLPNIYCNVLDYCVQYLLETIQEINNIIISIDAVLENYYNSYFSYFRSPNIYYWIEKLHYIKKPLNSRAQRFFNIAKVV